MDIYSIEHENVREPQLIHCLILFGEFGLKSLESLRTKAKFMYNTCFPVEVTARYII